MRASGGGLSAPPAGDRGPAYERGILLAGLAAVIGGQARFAHRDLTSAALLMVAGIALAAVAARLGRRSPEAFPTGAGPLARWEWWFLGASLAAAAAVRFVALDRWPPGGFFDEAQNVLVAEDLLRGHLAVYIGEYTQMPALYFYLLAGAVKLLGAHVEAARALSALIGTATVPAFYMLARRLFPGAPAVAATILIAGSRWHLNFSRIGFTGVLCPLLEIVSVLALLRAFERGRRRDWVALGATVGVGLQTYYAFNLFPAVLVVACALLVARRRDDVAPGGPRPVLRGLGVAALAAVLVLAPLGVFALSHPKEFSLRAATVAIWNPEHHLRVPAALWTNLRAHLLMFNFVGDSNPRHNLPGSPLLTSIEGVLLAFGFGCALGRATRWPQALSLVWFAVMMLPGILTIEAPQAYRTIGAVPAVFLLVAEALRAVLRSLHPPPGRLPSRAVGGAFAALALTAAFVNAAVYFALQVRDARAWDAFDATEDEVAETIRAEAHGFRVWLDPAFFDSPTVVAGLGAKTGATRFVVSDHLPVPRVEGPGTPPGDLYILDGAERDLVPAFRRAFPRATVRQRLDPFGRVILVTVAVPWPAGGPRPDPTLARFGLLGAFYPNLAWSGPPAAVRQDPAVCFHFHWHMDGLPGPFTADWAARLRIERAGEYAFHLLSTSPAAVVVDEKVVVAQRRLEDFAVPTGSINLDRGEHLLVVRYRREGVSSRLCVRWQPPGARRPEALPLEIVTPLGLEEYRRLAPGLPSPVAAPDR